MPDFLNAILHLDTTFAAVIADVGAWIYAILFTTIIAETGLVITPFLPGDSLLFTAGTFAAAGVLRLEFLLGLLSLAAIIGDSLNYTIGRNIGEKAFRRGTLFGIPIRQEYLERTRKFYEKYGAKTIILSRFMPILRTFAPFVAGVGKMQYSKFVFYNIIGGTIWVFAFVLGGYFFGNIPLIKENFTLAIFAIIWISCLPGIVGFLYSAKK
jgi:membrane-associated protein